MKRYSWLFLFLSWQALAQEDGPYGTRGVGNGGDTIETTSGTRSLANMISKEFDPQIDSDTEQEYAATATFLGENLAEQLPETAAFLKDKLERGPIDWHFTELKLVEVDDEGELPVDITSYNKTQAALNFLDKIILSRPEWRKIPAEDQLYLFRYELIRTTLGQTGTPGILVKDLVDQLFSDFLYRKAPIDRAKAVRDILAKSRLHNSPLYEVVNDDYVKLQRDTYTSDPAVSYADFMEHCEEKRDDFRPLLPALLTEADYPRYREFEIFSCERIFELLDGVNEITVASSGEDTFYLKYFVDIEKLWIRGDDLCDFRGIATLPYLKELEITGVRLGLCDLSPLDRLPSLVSLHIAGAGIAELNFESDTLRYLALPGNSLRRGLRLSERFPNLVVANLSDNPIRSLGALLADGDNTSLRELNLSDSRLLRSLDGIERFPNLVSLDISGTGIDEPTDMSRLQKLVELDVSDGNEHIQIFDLAELPIKSLNAEKSGLCQSDELPRSLVELNLKECSLTSIAHLRDLQSLHNLNLSENQILDLSPLQGMTSLRYLDVSENEIHTNVSTFPSLPALRYLDLSYTRVVEIEAISESKPANARHHFPNLIEIRLIKSEITNMRGLSDLSANLEVVDMRVNAPRQFLSLSSLPKLREFSIGSFEGIPDLSRIVAENRSLELLSVHLVAIEREFEFPESVNINDYTRTIMRRYRTAVRTQIGSASLFPSIRALEEMIRRVPAELRRPHLNHDGTKTVQLQVSRS